MCAKHARSPSPLNSAHHSPKRSHRSNEDSVRRGNPDVLREGTEGLAHTSNQTHLSKIELIPTELLHAIAWLAHNPLLYLVSKTINSKLFPIQDYEHDLALLLWCGREQGQGYCYQDQVVHEATKDEASRELTNSLGPLAWDCVPDKDFPWRTPMAESYNWKPGPQQRLQLQKDVFDLAWLTENKFQKFAKAFLKFWIDYRWQREDFSPADLKLLLESRQERNILDMAMPLSGMRAFTQDYKDRTSTLEMGIIRGCKVLVAHAWNNPKPSSRAKDNEKYVVHCLMDNLYIPSYVFEKSRPSSDDLLCLMRNSRVFDSSQAMNIAEIHFSKSRAIAELKDSVRTGNKVAFIRLFCLLLSQVTRKNLDHLDPKILEFIAGEQNSSSNNGDPYRKLWNEFTWHPIDSEPLDMMEISISTEETNSGQEVVDLFDIVARSDSEEIYAGLL